MLNKVNILKILEVEMNIMYSYHLIMFQTYGLVRGSVLLTCSMASSVMAFPLSRTDLGSILITCFTFNIPTKILKIISQFLLPSESVNLLCKRK